MIAALALWLGCDDHLFLGHPEGPAVAPPPSTSDTDLPTSPTTDADGFCAVVNLFNAECLGCHGTGGLGDLDLLSDPHAALVGVPSVADATQIRVVAGDPDASVLWQKLVGTQTVGDEMPLSGVLPADRVEVVRTWILEGASDACATTTPPTTLERTHALGYAAAEIHGMDAKFSVLPCISCHGADLAGDVGPSCDTCHGEGWRTDCTFCHGDPFDGTGAPPVHISGVDDGALASFIPHRPHTEDTDLHLAFACSACHVEPTDVLSPGHVFVSDITAGIAEMDFTGGLASAASWSGNGRCSNNYCHGDGQGANGIVDHDESVTTCHDCHADDTTEPLWNDMSGRHEAHLDEPVGGPILCADCHPGTVSESMTIVGVSQHVDGTAQAAPPEAVYNGATCTGTCHSEVHNARTWED